MEPALADAWLAWIAGNLLRRRPQSEIVEVLAGEGLPLERATTTVAEIADSAALKAVDGAVGGFRRASLLRRTVLRHAPRELLRIDPVPELYLQGFAQAQTPVVLAGATKHWPALSWTWEGLREAHGDASVSALTGRNADPAPDLEWEQFDTPLSFAQLIDLSLGDNGNDVYATARNKLSAGELSVLLADIPGIPGIVEDVSNGTAFLIGPAGAHTPLHYDISSVLLCQVLGRKRVWLVAPEEEVVESSNTYWAEPFDLTSAGVREVVLEPGDALSIPAGWWHAALALDSCFTVTLANLRVPSNRHDWLKER